MIKGLIPQEVCLSCQGCCRYREADSVWSPCLLDEEIQNLADSDIPSALISAQRRIRPISLPSGDGFVCPFLNIVDNKCKIYAQRPFECQLYPFLISMRKKKVYLTVDLNCPFVKENLNSVQFKEYTSYLADFINSPAQIRILKNNPHLVQAYEEVLDILELSPLT
jgi:uncharacterized protein